jgi:hypothetical protein
LWFVCIFLGCSVNFEFLNYTIITSKCKGPQYAAALCCSAFKEFACPYADQLNDGTNDCASTMFSYINLYGKYPPGLFASECKEGKEGLECTESISQKNSVTKSGAHQIVRSVFAVLSALLIAVLFWWRKETEQDLKLFLFKMKEASCCTGVYGSYL